MLMFELKLLDLRQKQNSKVDLCHSQLRYYDWLQRIFSSDVAVYVIFL